MSTALFLTVVRILLILVSVQRYITDGVTVTDPVSSSYVADVQRALKEKIPLHLALDDVPEKHKAAVQHQLEEMDDEFEDTKDKLDGV